MCRAHYSYIKSLKEGSFSHVDSLSLYTTHTGESPGEALFMALYRLRGVTAYEGVGLSRERRRKKHLGIAPDILWDI